MRALILVFTILTKIAFSQEISGIVMHKNQPIPFANIYVIGTSNGTFANSQGEFTLVVNSLKDTLTMPTSSRLDEGAYTFTYVVIDSAGNTSAASSGSVITVDFTAPDAPTAPDLVANDDSHLFCAGMFGFVLGRSPPFTPRPQQGRLGWCACVRALFCAGVFGFVLGQSWFCAGPIWFCSRRSPRDFESIKSFCAVVLSFVLGRIFPRDLPPRHKMAW